ncbi:MAG TPA: tRNA (adenosine(37)-N6)-threonylcarbamoyltransferase complex dimerization subunit type 1 TsaB [Bacteroidia bacterium]
MNLLCLETSAAICSVAVTVGERHFVLRSEVVNNHAESISGLIEQCLKAAGITLKDLNGVAISDGPGSYTGLRIGSSTAKGICFALQIPLIAVSTLKALALGAFKNREDAEIAWAMIDARRMEVYHGLFDRDLNQIQAITNGIITDSDFKPSHLEGKVVLCGDGAAKAESHFGFEDLKLTQDASLLIDLAIKQYTASDFADLASYEPYYLKFANITSSQSK